MKELKNYLHLYLGCQVLVPKEEYWIDAETKRKHPNDGIEKLESVSFAGDGTITVSWPEAGFMILYPEQVKPLLRPLSDMTEEECQKADALAGDGSFDADEDLKQYYTRKAVFFEPEEFKYLLSIGIDLFGLIEAGLAIDATTFTNKNNE